MDQLDRQDTAAAASAHREPGRDRDRGAYARMSTAPLSPQDVLAAAEVHRELGPDYSDAVLASFLEKVDREIDARVDARLTGTPQAQPATPASNHALLKGIVIGVPIWGIPAIMIAMADKGAPVAMDELQWLLTCWLVVAAICAAGAVMRVRRQQASRRTAADR